MGIKIIGTGSYLPSEVEKNEDFIQQEFLNEDGTPFAQETGVIIEKFKAITGIGERRYASKELNASDLAFYAAEKAIANANIDPETIDYIIVAHNFGDVRHGTVQSDMLPSLASRVKHLLCIKNPKCIAYDLIFGCPGWVEGMIQAHAFIRSGIAKRCMVIGAETLSRVVDKFDRDSMIFSDGAGATIIEATDEKNGILAHESASYTTEEAGYLYFGNSYHPDACQKTRFIKMHGRKIYEFALSKVPAAMKECLDKSGKKIDDVKKIFLHQANEKMDEAIAKRFFRLYKKQVPEGVMPMNIHKLGNSSVATIPTLLDMVRHDQIERQAINKGDVIIFASVGAGMNINALIYEV
ncbi:3-oxoacyl-ACP synthase III family protein [Sungkyunkwania multivorans]|uniref:3-oxoacyl-ACP synthase III family protein n=1 Tax=Sungkyunkwania multivorans TaxID=1173618 RepID=A0ABW3CYY3_9FLAO